jgi:hypothetical protein
MGSCLSALRGSGDNVHPIRTDEEAQFEQHVFHAPPPMPTDDAALYVEMQTMGLKEIPQTTSLFTGPSRQGLPPSSDARPPLTDAAVDYGVRTGRMIVRPKNEKLGRQAWDATSATKPMSQLSGGSDHGNELRAKLTEFKRELDDLDATGDNLTGEAWERHEEERQKTFELYSKFKEAVEEWESHIRSAQGK